MAKVVAEHMAVERLRDGSFQGVVSVLNDGIRVLEGETAIVLCVLLAFIAIAVLFFSDHGGGVTSRGLAVFNRVISVHGFNVTFLSISVSMALICFSIATVFHSMLSGCKW